MRWNAPLSPWAVGLVCLSAATGLGQAGEIYKSIDANGTVVYSDHADSSRAQTAVVLPAEPRYPPREMHVCGTQNCFTLMLVNGIYRRADGTDDSWTIETFNPSAVVLRRHGSTTADADVTYSGDVANDRLVNVKVNGNPMGGIDAAWGTALNTLPGSNAERDGTDAALRDVSAGTLHSDAMPPPLPVEDQPEIPVDGYLWTPGYWYWRNQGFFWIPGAWVRPPQTGFLWTPAFWVLAGTAFVFHPGHWGPTVGYYGGIDYGHGYLGNGYTGARWAGGALTYNSSVNHLSAAVRNTYSQAPPDPGFRNLTSYGPGTGGMFTRSANVTMSTAGRHQAAPAAAMMPARTTPAAAPARPPATANDPVTATANGSGRASAVPKPNRPRPVRAAPPKP